jgi:hypothetical protein
MRRRWESEVSGQQFDLWGTDSASSGMKLMPGEATPGIEK